MDGRLGRGALVLAIVAAPAACTKLVEFDQPLELPDFRDADTEVAFSCERDEDCSALGPCVICSSNVCTTSPDADRDGDGYFGVTCAGVEQGDDCDDADPGIHPDAEERCNARDDDCDTIVDEGEAFGPSWTVRQAGGIGPSPAPVAGRTGIAWVEGTAPCPTVMSAFLDASGVIRYPAILSSCGEDVSLTPRPSAGFAAVYVDRGEGGADIHLRLLDTLAQPDPTQPEAVNVSGDYEESDMPVAAWAASAFHFGTAWLSHDTDDRALMRVLFTTLSPAGAPLLAGPVQISDHQFRATSGIDSTFGERLEMVRVEDPTFDGFGVSWVEQDGIWFAVVVTSEDGTMVERVTTHSISDEVDTAGALLPSLAWADGRFVVAYARDDPDTLKASPDVAIVQITGHDAHALVAQPVDLPFDFPREATYPVVRYHPDIDELALAWADGRDGYGTRQVRFARLKLEEGAAGVAAIPVLDDLVLTDEGVYAGTLDMDVEAGAGFVVTWTERRGEDVGLVVEYLECRQ